MQAGDVQDTYADIRDLERDFGFSPKTQLNDGIEKFVAWYTAFYEVKIKFLRVINRHEYNT